MCTCISLATAKALGGRRRRRRLAVLAAPTARNAATALAAAATALAAAATALAAAAAATTSSAAATQPSHFLLGHRLLGRDLLLSHLEEPVVFTMALL